MGQAVNCDSTCKAQTCGACPSNEVGFENMAAMKRPAEEYTPASPTPASAVLKLAKGGDIDQLDADDKCCASTSGFVYKADSSKCSADSTPEKSPVVAASSSNNNSPVVRTQFGDGGGGTSCGDTEPDGTTMLRTIRAKQLVQRVRAVVAQPVAESWVALQREFESQKVSWAASAAAVGSAEDATTALVESQELAQSHFAQALSKIKKEPGPAMRDLKTAMAFCEEKGLWSDSMKKASEKAMRAGAVANSRQRVVQALESISRGDLPKEDNDVCMLVNKCSFSERQSQLSETIYEALVGG